MLVIEHSPAASNAGLAVTSHIPRKAKTAADVVIVSEHAVFRHSGISSERDTRWRVFESLRADSLGKIFNREAFDAASHFMPWRGRLISQAEIQRQPGIEFEIILEE